jgi:fatty acid desaturase
MAYQRPKIDQDIVREAREPSTWKSPLLATSIYGAVVGLACLYEYTGLWWLIPPIFLVIGGLQNHLLILLHEGSHHHIHPNRLLNDILTDSFCAYPFLTFQVNYRLFHLNHHKYSGSPERDPEVKAYEAQNYYYARKSGLDLIKMMVADLFGINLIRTQLSSQAYAKKLRDSGKEKPLTPREIILFIVFWGIFGSLFTYYEIWQQVLVFWFLPQVFVMFPLLKLHGYGEHTGATGPTEYQRTWVHNFNPITNFFIYPINSGFHLEHHMFPMIPWFNMQKFRKALLEHPEFATESQAVTVDGFFFGKRTIWKSMIAGAGDYRTGDLHANIEEMTEDVISPDADEEIDAQLS